MADVEKMFLQIKVDERNDDALRYLCRDLKSDDFTENLQVAEIGIWW